MKSEPRTPDAIAVLRARIAAFHARPCDMAHERVVLAADGKPLSGAASESGYRRLGVCPASVRAGNLACNHTMARVVLQQALDALGDDTDAERDALQDIDGALGPLDHRRYEAESRRADAIRMDDAEARTAAESAIAASITEHRALGLRIRAIRDAILGRLAAEEKRLRSRLPTTVRRADANVREPVY